MTLFELLVRQAAQGTIKPFQLLQSARAGDIMQVADNGARFRKLRAGAFQVEMFTEGNFDKPSGSEMADSPVGAKLTALEWLVSATREAQEAEQDNDDTPPPAPAARPAVKRVR